MVIPTTDTYQVFASAILDGNSYTSAPLAVTGSMGFLAQVLQVKAQGTYEFDVLEFPSTASNQLTLQQTCINPVTFTITKDGKPLQNVVGNDSYRSKTLDISNTFYIYAVIHRASERHFFVRSQFPGNPCRDRRRTSRHRQYQLACLRGPRPQCRPSRATTILMPALP